MVEYQAIFFWLGGVLMESILDATLAVISINADKKVDLNTRIAVRGIVEDITLGHLSPLEYCQWMIDAGGSQLQVVDLESRLIDRMGLNPGVVQVIQEVPETFQKWLLLDYPTAWLEQCHDAEELAQHFPLDRRILASSLKAKQFGPEFYSAVPKQVEFQLSDCLLVDADSARAVSAIRQGLASLIYVYPEHLKHEFALQGIIQTDAEVLHPSSSERVDI
jgi:hypothetical protein